MSITVGSVTPLLQVYDMQRSVGFYRDVLGFELEQTSTPDGDYFDWCMLRQGNAVVMLNTAYEREHRPDTEPERPKDNRNIALFMGGSVNEAYAHLQAKGWPSRPPFDTPYGMRQLYFRDPDGNELCIQHAIPASES